MRQAGDRFSARYIAVQLVHLFQQPEPMRPDRVAQSSLRRDVVELLRALHQ